MKTLVFSLGGSIIAPDKPDYFFLREFKNFIIKYLEKYRIVIICGGGKTSSYYVEAAKRISNIKDDDLDWLGIMATRLNAELVRIMFGDLAHDTVIYNPHEKIKTTKRIIIGAGYKPGSSTDYDAVILAQQLDAKTVLNLSNIAYVYNKDPNKNKDAEKIFELNWKQYRKMVGSKWTPRLNSPFDPIASIEAEKFKLKVVILKGTDLRNIGNYLENKNFEGTIIRG